MGHLLASQNSNNRTFSIVHALAETCMSCSSIKRQVFTTYPQAYCNHRSFLAIQPQHLSHPPELTWTPSHSSSTSRPSSPTTRLRVIRSPPTRTQAAVETTPIVSLLETANHAHSATYNSPFISVSSNDFLLFQSDRLFVYLSPLQIIFITTATTITTASYSFITSHIYDREGRVLAAWRPDINLAFRLFESIVFVSG